MTSTNRWTRILTDVTNALLTFTNPQKLITGGFLRTSAKKFLIWNKELLALVEVLNGSDYEEGKVNLTIWASVIRVFMYPLSLIHRRNEHQSAARMCSELRAQFPCLVQPCWFCNLISCSFCIGLSSFSACPFSRVFHIRGDSITQSQRITSHL
jgi:hypothetical protein